MILNHKDVIIMNSGSGETIAEFLNKKFSIPMHLSEEKSFMSLEAIALSKSLSPKRTKQINQMYYYIFKKLKNNCNFV